MKSYFFTIGFVLSSSLVWSQMLYRGQNINANQINYSNVSTGTNNLEFNSGFNIGRNTNSSRNVSTGSNKNTNKSNTNNKEYRNTTPAQRAVPAQINRNPSNNVQRVQVAQTQNNRGNQSPVNSDRGKIQRSTPATNPIVNNVQTQGRGMNNSNVNINPVQNEIITDNNRNLNANEDNDVQIQNYGNLNDNIEAIPDINMNVPQLALNNVNELDIQITTPQINIQKQSKLNISTEKEKTNTAINFPQINIVKTEKVKTEKVKIEKMKTGNSEIAEAKAEKRKSGGSAYYQQKKKSYTAKKIKIWFRKNFKGAKKIRLSVSCPKF